MATVPNNYFGLPPQQSWFGGSEFVILPVPYDATTSFMGGTRNGPAAILAASQQVELFDLDYQQEFVDAGIATCDPVMPNVAGPGPMMDDIEEAAAEIHAEDKFLLALGGEHSISAPLVRAAKQKYPNLSVLQIDAHADLRDTYEGSPHSHACVMRRVHESNVPCSAVGIRNYCEEEAAFIKEYTVPVLTSDDCAGASDWIERALEPLTDDVYITVDIDGFDPAYAPGTGTPEPAGLDWRQVRDLVHRVAQDKRIVSADIVEVTPIPGQVVTEFLAAKLAYKLIACAQMSRR